MIFLRGAPPPFSLTWQYDEATKSVNTVDQEISGSMAGLCQILLLPGLLQYAFSDLLVFRGSFLGHFAELNFPKFIYM